MDAGRTATGSHLVRLILAALFATLAAPLHAWEARVEGPVCLLHYSDAEADVTVSYDPRREQPYGIALTRIGDAWSDAPVFAMRFDGPGGLTISTDRHTLSNGDATLSVTDTGFGNVLRGLEANHVATALLGEKSMVLPLAGAAEEVARFRACATTPTV